MNLNDFVVLHNSKAKSVKLNARNLQELQMETVTLSLESKDMEEKLQQLKQSMRKEKEERGHSGGFRWTSGQCGSSNNNVTNSAKKFKENRLQKLSAGKMKIRMLKTEPLTVQPQPPPLPPTIGPRTIRKNRLTGTICGQCEVKTAGLSCVECTEHYCIGCFARFHQKGALKLHRMIPIQTELQTRVSTRDVVDYYPSTFPSPGPCSKPGISHTPMSNAGTRQDEQSPEKGREAVTKPMQLQHDTSQVLVVNYTEEKNFESGVKREDERGFPSSLLRGEYNEVESARSFQEAVRQWRGQTSDGAGEPISEEAMWIPDRPVSVSATATQADLSPDREAEGQGRGGGQGRVPLRVEFSDNSLTYMDRLLLKKQRRTPIEMYDPLSALDLKPQANTEEESSLTAQEEDFRCYCASLFAVPVSGGETRAQITAPEPCLVIEFLDETDRDMNGVSAEQRTSSKSKDHLFDQVPNKGKTLVPQTAVTGGGSSRVSRSSLSPSRPSSQSKAPTQPQAAQRLHPSEPQTSEADHSNKPLPSKSMPTAYFTAETPRTSQTSIQTSKSQKPICSTTVPKSKAEHGSPPRLSSLPHPEAKIPKSSRSPLSSPPDVFPLATTRSPFPNQPLSPSPSDTFMLGSTFTVSPSSSIESTLSPKVCHSTPLQQSSDSSLLPERQQPSTLFPESISSPKLFQSPPNNLESLEKSQHSLSDPESLLSDNQFQLPQSSRPSPQPKSLEPSQSQALPAPLSATLKAPLSLSLFNETPPDANSRRTSTPTYGDAPVLMSPCSFSGNHESTLSQRDTQCIPTLSSQSLNVIQNHPFALKLDEEEELSVDSGDEMSSDSLGPAPHNEGSSDEETQMHGRLTRGRSREEERGNSVTSHLGDSFVPTDADIEKDLQTDEPEHLSEPYMVMHNWSAGSGSEQSCDLERFSPLSVDLSSSLSNTPERTSCDALRTCQTPSHDSDPKGSESCGPSSRLSTNTERQLVSRMMEDSNTQPTGIQICSSTTSRRGEISAYELGTSASNWSNKSTPTLSHPTTSTPSPLRPPVFPSFSQSRGPVVRPLSQAAQEIMDICRLDQTGCEDPDLDTDTTAHALHGLEQDLKETGTEASLFAAVNSGRQSQQGNHRLTRDRVSDEQREAEEAAKRDQQSVLLLP
ncbi:mucin-17 isoform X2 [Hippoglossus hippoglossus]|uniref:mucin-17 isoform X2 n=1 Tax=Hippoglossus hippoglossus TaxID=8267 RepID=UPI00148E516E|nr:mucin-17 isoform X2 [Hippoglossus hippoglossus]